MSQGFYRLYIAGHKLDFFVYSFHHRCEQQGKCNRIILIIEILLRFDLFHIFDALTFILQVSLTV